AIEMAIKAYLNLEVDDFLDLEGHVQIVYERSRATKNAGYQISDRQAIRHLLNTLASHEECIGKFLFKEMGSIFPSGSPHDIECVDFCNAFIEYWQTYLEEVISHFSSDLGVTMDSEVTQPLRIDEVNQPVGIID
ncbi:Hypothetical predicted protein, partial [Olea europaea subsp. europaea]